MLFTIDNNNIKRPIYCHICEGLTFVAFNVQRSSRFDDEYESPVQVHLCFDTYLVILCTFENQFRLSSLNFVYLFFHCKTQENIVIQQENIIS